MACRLVWHLISCPIALCSCIVTVLPDLSNYFGEHNIITSNGQNYGNKKCNKLEISFNKTDRPEWPDCFGSQAIYMNKLNLFTTSLRLNSSVERLCKAARVRDPFVLLWWRDKANHCLLFSLSDCFYPAERRRAAHLRYINKLETLFEGFWVSEIMFRFQTVRLWQFKKQFPLTYCR